MFNEPSGLPGDARACSTAAIGGTGFDDSASGRTRATSR